MLQYPPEKQRSLLALAILCVAPFVCDRCHFCPLQRGYLLTTKPRVLSGGSRSHSTGRIEDHELNGAPREGEKKARRIFVGAQA